MASSVKDKTMPTISPNVYSGLQKWVNRASTSLRGPRRNRNASDAGLFTTTQENQLDNMTSKLGKIVPAHGRSRSTPVEMPETFASFPQKIPKVVRQEKKERAKRKDSSDFSDDNSSKGSGNEGIAKQNKRLMSKLSRSEGNLMDSGFSRQSKSFPIQYFAPRRSSHLRTVSDGGTSGLAQDSSCSQALNRTNIEKKQFTRQDNDNTIEAIKTEQSSTNHENTSKSIHTRLDMWLEKTSFEEYRQSSFDSTSSSEDLFDESKTRKEETKLCFRDLQSALDELVSSCGKKHSITNNNYDKTSKRKNSLKDTNEKLDNNAICQQSQDHRKTTFRKERGGSSTDSGLVRDTHLDDEDINDLSNEVKTRTDLQSSYDSSDAGYIDERETFCNDPSHHSIGPSISNGVTCLAENSLAVHAPCDAFKSSSHDKNNKNYNLKGNHNEERKASRGMEQNDNILLRKARTSSSSSTSSLRLPKTSLTQVFDDDLEAFAMKCLAVSQNIEERKNKLKTESDEEKKTALDLDYVFIPRKHDGSTSTTHSGKDTDSPTNPSITFNEMTLTQGAFSDDEVYKSHRDSTLSNFKRDSQDSLDGLVLFTLPEKDIEYANPDTNSFSSNETANSKDNLKVDESGYALRKFPSMPLFYVPNDGGERKSLGKSLWKKLKSLPRSNENRSSPPNTLKPRHSIAHVQADPFYHGENDKEEKPRMRPKSNSMALGGGRRRSRDQRRLSLLDLKRSTANSEIQIDRSKVDKIVENPQAKPLESQC